MEAGRGSAGGPSFSSSPGPGLETSLTHMRILRGRNLTAMSDSNTAKWMCEACGFIYDPEEGDPDGGIPAGTPFEAIPDTWYCPVCGAKKSEFVLYED